MRVLIIEDDKNLSQIMRQGLQQLGFTIDIADDGAEGGEKAEVNEYDAILLDLNLPDCNGLEVLQTLREHENSTPIIIVTARGETKERTEGLNLGADDYITKPFDFLELQARINAVIRRAYGRTRDEIRIGKLTISPCLHKATIEDKELSLSAKEFDILHYIASRHPEVVSSESILEHVYDEFFDPFSSVLRVHIANLRRKISSHQDKIRLITIKGKGYVLCEKD